MEQWLARPEARALIACGKQTGAITYDELTNDPFDALATAPGASGGIEAGDVTSSRDRREKSLDHTCASGNDENARNTPFAHS